MNRTNSVKQKPQLIDFIEKNPKIPVILLGWFYVVTSLSQMFTLYAQKDWYFGLYGYMPDGLAAARYLFSWFQRVFAIVVAAGLMRFKEIYRKILIGFCLFVMATLYWKHPYAAFLEHTRVLDRKFGHMLSSPSVPNLKITFESLVIPSLVGHYVLDIVFCCAVIYFLIREPVKKLFTK
jgi:hypothetical protein